MAYPLKTNCSVNLGPGVILKRPELAAQIGSICADWAFIEDNLAGFYSELMGFYLPTTPGFIAPSHPVGLQIFEEVLTIHSRTRLVYKLAEWVIKEPLILAQTRAVLNKIKKVSKGRNTVAHGVWGITDSEPDALILIPDFGHQMVYKKRDFELISDSIKNVNEEFGKVQLEVYNIRNKHLRI